MTEWQRCRPWIEAAVAECGGTHTIEDVEAGLVAGHYQFWPGKRSACVTEVIDHPRKRVMSFWLLGGDLRELLAKIEPEAREWGLSVGCSLFIGHPVDRPGWARVLAKHGYAPGWRVFRRSECH